MQKSQTPSPNFSQNQVFRLEGITTFTRNEKENILPSYLEKKYCTFMSNPSIISCRAFDNSIAFNIDILFPTFEEGKTFKIINHEFQTIDIINANQSKVVYEKLTMNKNDLRFYLITVKFKIEISLDPLKGNFALIQSGENLYSLFMNDHNIIMK